jgi:hypothetical protein
MTRTPWLFSSLAIMALAACNGNKGNNNGSTAGAGTESGTMQNGATRTDTGMAAMDTAGGGMSGMSSDTATGGARIHSDTNRTGASTNTGATGTRGNQTKSGVTNTKTGKSTLGKGVTKTRPDQGQPVTSKGDTIAASPDSSANR